MTPKIDKKNDFFSKKGANLNIQVRTRSAFFFCFLTSNFIRFFAALIDFGLILGGPGPSKKFIKIENIAFGALCLFHGRLGEVSEGFWEGLGDDFGAILGYLGWILGGLLNFLIRSFIDFWSFQRALGNR